MTVQVWDFITGKLKKDLQFQADEQFMMHDEAVLALSFSKDSELLVSGSQDGKIKVSRYKPEGLARRTASVLALLLFTTLSSGSASLPQCISGHIAGDHVWCCRCCNICA